MKKYIVELFGTFFLVFTVGACVVPPSAPDLAPLAIGSVLAVMIFAGGHISGGHFNPAVSLAAMLRGALPARDIPFYILFQVIGAILAAVAIIYVKGAENLGAVEPLKPDIGPALLVEFLFTTALAWVVLNVATAKGTNGNSFYGFAIGFTVVAGAFAVGSVSGAVFNPAVAIGISILGISEWSNIWIYLVACFAGSVAAASLFKFTHPDES